MKGIAPPPLTCEINDEKKAADILVDISSKCGIGWKNYVDAN